MLVLAIGNAKKEREKTIARTLRLAHASCPCHFQPADCDGVGIRAYRSHQDAALDAPGGPHLEFLWVVRAQIDVSLAQKLARPCVCRWWPLGPTTRDLRLYILSKATGLNEVSSLADDVGYGGTPSIAAYEAFVRPNFPGLRILEDPPAKTLICSITVSLIGTYACAARRARAARSVIGSTPLCFRPVRCPPNSGARADVARGQRWARSVHRGRDYRPAG